MGQLRVSEATAEVLSMAKEQSDLDAGIKKMLALNDSDAEVTTIVEVGLTESQSGRLMPRR